MKSNLLQSYLEAIQYRVTGGSEFLWHCFGRNARTLDSEAKRLDEFSMNAIFDSKTQRVYSIEAHDYVESRAYRWIDPEFRDAHTQEAQDRDVDPNNAWDDTDFIDVEIPEDILEKISKMHNGEEYDTRIMIPLDLSDAEQLELMRRAHELDITFNELVCGILTKAIADMDLD